ncbi:DUF4844 domain-containing protein [Shewanella sp. 3B26]|uniref:DUF4844 domain-containing protein n=1 Tax=Shewanella zhuhaiensis TaxID=2919576 RepID=A0AAJ1FB25_9GAMM|nr:DUF4844 domain-containing protein [Shewanella zhuhaiensis]MCH4294680.1 DUF4844 domain-containing protein [Shewanella zhuhaiensis]
MLKLLIKLVVGFFLALLILVGLGISGAYFYIWPTFLNDQKLNVSDTVIVELANILEEKKFYPAPYEFYFGAPSENIRIDAEAKVNLALKEIIQAVKTNPKKSAVLFSIKSSLKNFQEFDSEENERALYYFERVLEILNIHSSNELFNVWRYGFPYGWFLKNA